MKTIISGPSGFIGKNLLKKLKNSYGASIRNADIDKLFQGGDVIINTIGKAHDRNAIKNDYYTVNFDLTKKIFNSFKNSEATLLIHLSSIAAVEELESKTALKEGHECNPSSHYGQSKRMAEEWLLNQKLPKNKKLIILRPPMVHGLGDKGNLRFLYKFISNGLPYPFIAFENKRSFIGIDNFIFFIEQIIKNNHKLESGIYHISDDEALSTTEIVSVIKRTISKKGLVIKVPKNIIILGAKLGDFLPFFPLNTIRLKKMTSNLIVSNKKIKTALGIEKLPYTAGEGLIKTIQSFKLTE